MIRVLFAGRPEMWPAYRPELERALAAAGIEADVTDDPASPETITYMVYAPNGPVSDFRPFVNLRAVLSLWAGVEGIVTNPTLTQPLARMVDPGLTEGMRDYVTGHVLRHHLGIPALAAGQDGIWRNDSAVPPLARERPVGILGKGALGMACARALAGLGFPVAAWGRRPSPSAEGIEALAGPEGFAKLLSRSEILVGLLPSTPETRNLLDATAFARMPRGAAIINAGRGDLIDDDALLAALDSGQVGGATLDVFRTEPLPADHPYWRHPRILVTPHVAAETRPATASEVIAENIRRAEAGQPLLYLVDRPAGY